MSSPSYFKKSIAIVMRTLPFLGLNAVVYGAFFFASLIWFAFWGGLAFLMARLGIGLLAVVFVIIGFGAWAGIVKFARRYLLYMVKGAHIAAMTQLIKTGSIPQGKGQYAYGKEVIQKHFKDVSILFGLDMLVTGSLKALQRRLIRVTGWLPLPSSANKAIRIATEILNRSLTYVDEAILSYAIYREEENVWNSARHGVILYAQSFKPILITAAKVWAIGHVIGFFLFLLLLVPGIFVILLFSAYPIVQVVVLVLCIVGAWALKAAFFEPFALAYSLVTYHYTIAGMQPDPSWDEKLLGVSSQFQKLVTRAKEAGPKPFTPTPAPVFAE